MKKTLTVNISGIVFHIDEDAYKVLHDYLQSIKKHFAREEGGDEIVSDIEARIAEMLKDRIGNDRQVITIDDIEEVIKVIGLPEEFGETFSDEPKSESSTDSKKATKRLYRDPENSVLGGVCGGLGAYFHTDPVWFRLAFVILSIPGIGTPLLVYIVLWIVIPEARTTAERLEMRGEKVNISNIEKSIREEITNLKDKFNEFTKEAKRTYKKKSAAHRSDFQQVENAFQTIGHIFLRILLIFIGFILAVTGLSLVIAFLVMFFGFGYDVFVFDSEVAYISINRLTDLIVGSFGNSMIFRLSFFLMIGIPVAMLLYGGIKLIFGLDRTRYVGITALNIWIVSLIITAVYGFQLFRDFSSKGVASEKTELEIPADNILHISSRSDDAFDRINRFGEYIEIDDSNIILTSDDQNLLFGLPQVEFECSDDRDADVEVYYHALGKNRGLAEERALQTIYNYRFQDGNLIFDPYFSLAQDEVWRSQKVEVVVTVPQGTILQISENMKSLINEHVHSPYRVSGRTWIMTPGGLEEAPEILPPSQPDTLIEREEKADPAVNQDNSDASAIQPVSVVGFMISNVRNMVQMVIGV